MHIFYRISDTGYNKVKPDYINNELCLCNFVTKFSEHQHNIHIIADNVSKNTYEMIQKYIPAERIQQVSVGHGAGTFNIVLNEALKLPDTEIVYFVENDYVHHYDSPKAIEEAINNLGAHYVTLYDHPDKYLNADQGGNPFVQHGGETTRVLVSRSGHWKFTNSTTMTFAAAVRTLKQDQPILRKHTAGKHPDDFNMFLELNKNQRSLISPLPAYATHGETQWLSPGVNWEGIVKNDFRNYTNL